MVTVTLGYVLGPDDPFHICAVAELWPFMSCWELFIFIFSFSMLRERANQIREKSTALRIYWTVAMEVRASFNVCAHEMCHDTRLSETIIPVPIFGAQSPSVC